jgi:hypothetical protein
VKRKEKCRLIGDSRVFVLLCFDFVSPVYSSCITETVYILDSLLHFSQTPDMETTMILSTGLSSFTVFKYYDKSENIQY